jgi:guanine deaminase
VLGLEKKIGNFEPGKAFDALIVDPYAAESPFDVFENDSTLDVFQKFIFMGNNKNIEAVFVNGKQVLQ